MKRRGFGYTPPPKSRAKEMAGRTGAAERLDAIARQKADAAGDDHAPLPDAARRLSLAERTAIRRSTLGPGLDLDAQIARDKEAALAKPNSPEFVQRLRQELGLSETGARLYALALRAIDTPELRQTTVAIADPETGLRGHRINTSVQTTGPGGPPPGWSHYFPSRLPAQAILGFPAGAQLTGPQWAEAAKALENAHREWESLGLLEWQDRGSRGLLRL